MFLTGQIVGAQWLGGRVLDSRPRQKCRGFEPHRRHCVVSLSKNINPSLVLVQPRKTRPYITERLLMGRKESNQTGQIVHVPCILSSTIELLYPCTQSHFKFYKDFLKNDDYQNESQYISLVNVYLWQI